MNSKVMSIALHLNVAFGLTLRIRGYNDIYFFGDVEGCQDHGTLIVMLLNPSKLNVFKTCDKIKAAFYDDQTDNIVVGKEDSHNV